MSTITCLEALPNEIIIECFEYFNAPDLLYSFQRLNSRFEQLIQDIFLSLNFQHIKKTTFDQFCRYLLFNPQIKRQISSLKLSNENNTCGQIQAFLSLFSFDEFPHLRSLTLINVEQNELNKIQSILPSLSNLRYVSLDCPEDATCPRLYLSLLSKCQTLIIPTLLADLSSIQQPILITKLTIASCTSWRSIDQLFRCAPRLKYLNIHKLTDDGSHLNKAQSSCLKKLVLNVQEIKFDRLATLLKQTPTLETLILYSSNGTELVDADRWEHFISSSLPCLHHFQFHFEFILEDPNWTPLAIVDKFQTHFWQKQHHWFTACEFKKDTALIYTIPYRSSTYRLTMYSNRYCDYSFENVTELELLTGALRKDFQHYFPNVKSLRLENAYYSDGAFGETSGNIESLKKIVNLSNLKHLDIASTCRMEARTILFKIMKEAPQLSSLRIDVGPLITLINDDHLCKYLNKMIHKLDVVKHNDHCNISSSMIERFCRIFSHVEQLRFPIQRSDDVFLFLKHLTHLSSITVRCLFFPIDADGWLNEMARKLNKTILFKPIRTDYDVLHPMLHIWVGENIH